MKRTIRFVSVALVAVLLLSVMGPASGALTRDQRRTIMKGAVLILPLKIENGKVVDIPWSGSGTIVDDSGLILTNYHVVEETGDWDILGILITTQSDQRPEPAYLAQIVTKDPDVDLAVIKIVADFQGEEVDPAKLNLSVVELGDADDLELGDELDIFGYPGIGSGTITYTEGKVSGFLQEEGIDYQRAWIKTDASISGGNSGGTAVDADGKLVGVPTLASEVDVRHIADTNGDGVIDENDAAVPTGGFINHIRPINLAFPLINQAKSGMVEPGTQQPINPGPTTPSTTTGASFSKIIFASEIDRNKEPVDPATRFPNDITSLYAFTEYQGLQDGAECGYTWYIDGVNVLDKTFSWAYGEEGTFYLSLRNGGDPMPEGEYTLQLTLDGDVVQSGSATVGQAKSDLDQPPEQTSLGVTLSGYIVDADTGRAVVGAYFVVLTPGVTVQQFAQEQKDEQVSAIGISDKNGYYSIAPPLARGYTYSVLILAQGYQPIAEDDVLTVGENVPDSVELDPIAMVRQ